jgi:GTP-binding protein
MNPFFQRASFLTAVTRTAQAPDDSGREVVFAGRSNSGKSSAINALCHQKALARTSRTPGRTQQIIFFALDGERRLVDLPGYGYAKVSEAIKLEWQRHMAEFLERRRSLAGLVIVMDIRHPLTDYDRQMLQWGLARGLPVLLLLAKADKLKRGAARSTQLAVERTLTASTRDQVRVMPFSTLERIGIEPVQALLEEWLGSSGHGTARPADAGRASGEV